MTVLSKKAVENLTEREADLLLLFRTSSLAGQQQIYAFAQVIGEDRPLAVVIPLRIK